MCVVCLSKTQSDRWVDADGHAHENWLECSVAYFAMLHYSGMYVALISQSLNLSVSQCLGLPVS